jgi:alpha-glucosidase
VYNDGAAFKYVLPGAGQYSVSWENSGFRIPAGASGWVQPWSPSYENEFSLNNLSAIDSSSKNWGHPLLLKLLNNHWVLIGEANLDGGYASLHFTGSNGQRIIKMAYPPDQTTAITGNLPFVSPWRVILLGDSLKTIVESNIFLNLCPPTSLVDQSWIKPGRVAWSWWADFQSPGNLSIQKQYVDFAAEMNWEYVLVDEGWNQSWITELVNYAKSKNVSIMLWYNWTDFTEWTPTGWILSETTARSVFSKIISWGVKGVKIDFLDSDSQERMKYYDLINRLAAEYKVMVNYHGSTKPGGERRTWPNELTREAVMGAEYFKFLNKAPPGSTNLTTLPYTRNILGPMDFTPGNISNLRQAATASQQVSLAVLFESGLIHYVDSPANYRASPARDFLKAVPATWDETKFISGYPGSSAVIARRKNNDWFVGAIATEAGMISIPTAFLSSGVDYQAIIYQDGLTDSEISSQSAVVSHNSVVNLTVRKNGGGAVWLRPGAGNRIGISDLRIAITSLINIFNINTIVSNYGK